MKILWAEDEQKLLAGGTAYLTREGHTVTGAHTYEEALKLLNDTRFDLLILDWVLPEGKSGLELCKIAQSRWGLPVIMVTAKSDEFDKVLALEVGADDYIAKPFGMRELSARLKAVWRRTQPTLQGSAQAAADSRDKIIVRGDLHLDITRHQVNIQGSTVELTRTEFRLLAVLAENPGRVFSRSHLLDEALGDGFAGYERTIDSHIRNLRRKVEKDPSNPEYIKTVFGIGYKFGDSRT